MSLQRQWSQLRFCLLRTALSPLCGDILCPACDRRALAWGYTARLPGRPRLTITLYCLLVEMSDPSVWVSMAGACQVGRRVEPWRRPRQLYRHGQQRVCAGSGAQLLVPPPGHWLWCGSEPSHQFGVVCVFSQGALLRGLFLGRPAFPVCSE